MTDTIVSSPHVRALEDILQAERALRMKAEGEIKQYVNLLTEIAANLDGERLEEERLSAPDALASWGVSRWRKFFGSVANAGKGWGATRDSRKVAGIKNELERVRQELKALEDENASLRAEIQSLAEQKPETAVGEATKAAFEVSHAAILDALKNIEVPSGLDVPLGTSPTSKARALKYLYLAHAWGISTRMEIGYLLALHGGTSINSAGGKAKKDEERLVKAGLLSSEAVPVNGTDILLTIVHPTDAGKSLCARLGWQEAVSEWGRFDASATWLGFLLQARVRGYVVRYQDAGATVLAKGDDSPLFVAKDRLVVLDAAQVAVVDVPSLFDVRLNQAHNAPLFTE
ncbi:hypothetical protein D6833_09620 [Candidatus Parcubacteria bacterium]|nr:MAG: hypothetical protein D6833_09620 [Candidatus Parcubacteria bacterium]